MSRPEVDGLNTGYAALLLEQYLDNPGAVPTEWRALFESAPEDVLAMQPGLARLVELLERHDGNGAAAVEALRERHPDGGVPRPAGWGGYRLQPDTYEFWQHDRHRMHDRFRYTSADGVWLVERLGP